MELESNYLKTLFEDNEQVSEIKNLKDIINGEELIFSNKITKIKKNTEEERVIILTDKKLYNFKGKKYRSKIEIKNIFGFTLSKTCDEFVIHTCENEYDFHYMSDIRSKIIELVSRIYFCLYHSKINLNLVEDDMLDNYVTSKVEKKNGITKFETKNFMDVDQFLYGNLNKKISGTLSSVSKNLKSEIIFYNPITCSNMDLKKLRIENFRHLEVLSLSVYGDVVLAEYKPTGTIYFVRTINSSDTNEFCLSFDLLMDINMSNDFPFMAVLDILLKTQTTTYLITSFKDNFEGGYLISKVYDCGIFCEANAIFFGAQIALIISYFHKKNISFLGFSPQNFLIGQDGYIKYVDYEMDYNTVKKNASKICKYNGPPEYNTVLNDWYNFGVIMYEMLFGNPPDCEDGLKFPKYFTVSEAAKKFLEEILLNNGYKKFNLEEVKKTELFKEVNFDDILNKKINAKLRFLNDHNNIPQIPVLSGTQKQNTEPSYNILNFNSIDLEY